MERTAFVGTPDPDSAAKDTFALEELALAARNHALPLEALRYPITPPGLLQGRAWSGWGPIVRVEVSTDGGQTWQEARLDEAPAPVTWQAWSFAWEAVPGTHDLCCRATDGAGHSQPWQVAWNRGGYANNAVQHLVVVVR